VTALAAELRRHFTAAKSPVAQIDRGTSVRQWSETSPPRLLTVGVDGRWSEAELIQAAYTQLEEQRFGTRRMQDALCPRRCRPSLACLFKQNTEPLPPWFLDDGDNKTKDDARLRSDIDSIVKSTTRRLKREGETAGTLKFQSALADRLLAALFISKKHGGLELHHSKRKEFLGRDGVETYRHGVGSCHGLSFIYYALARRAGLKPQFIRVAGERNPETQQMEEAFHVAVALALDPAQPQHLTAFDPSTGRRLKDQDTQWYPLTHLEMAAYQLRNIAVSQSPVGLSADEQRSWQEGLLQQALQLAPNNFEILRHLAWFYNEVQPDKTASQDYWHSAQAINPRLRGTWAE